MQFVAVFLAFVQAATVRWERLHYRQVRKPS